MASLVAFLVTLLVLQPIASTGDFLAPLLSPIFDDVCKKVECGKGKCNPSHNSTLLYECECEKGWKQTRSSDDDDLKFLPCIVPNCTMDYTCMAAASPAEDRRRSGANESIFDPCYWADCGGGSCNKTSQFTYRCACAEGYYNLLNVSAFPCYRECAIGMDCANLGISMSNKSVSPTPVLPDNGTSQGIPTQQAGILWLMALSMTIAFI